MKKLTCLGMVVQGMLLCLAETATAQYMLPYAVRLDVSKYFGERNAFSATVEYTEGEQKIGQTNGPNLVFKFAYLNGMTRSEVDMSEWQDPTGRLGIPMEGMREDMRRYSTERVITIINPHKAVVFTIYPKLKSYVRMSFKEDTAKELKNIPTPASSTELNKETIDGHSSLKCRVTFAEEGEFVRREAWGLYGHSGGQALLWKATELGGLPIKFEGRTGTGYQILVFKELKPGKPAAKLFEPPSGYAKFESIEALYKAKVKQPQKN